MSSTLPRERSGARLFATDFDELETGEQFVTAGRVVTEADVASFAGLTGDFHPQHLDAEWARQSPFGERVAHGMLVLSFAVGLIPLDPDRVVALRRVDDAVFKRPARLGDTIHVDGRVESLKEVDELIGIVACALKVVGLDEATLARVRLEVLWRRGPVVPTHADAPAVSAVPDPSCGLPL